MENLTGQDGLDKFSENGIGCIPSSDDIWMCFHPDKTFPGFDPDTKCWKGTSQLEGGKNQISTKVRSRINEWKVLLI